MTRDLFSSFQRLQNFPLDISSLYETLEKLNKYIESSGVAYAGQIVGVYKDNEDLNGVYIIVDENGKLVPKKSASQTDLDNLGNQVKNEIQVKLDKITKILGDDESGDETGLIQKVNDLQKQINYIIDNKDGKSPISNALDSIKEISDWINKNQNGIVQFNTFKTETNSKFQEKDNQIKQLQKKDILLDSKISDNSAKITDLQNKTDKIESDISDINIKIDRLPHYYHSSAQPLPGNSLDAPLFNATFRSGQTIKTIDIYNRAIVEPTEMATVKVLLKNITTNDSIPLVTNSMDDWGNGQNFLDTSVNERFHYEINYLLPNDSGSDYDEYKVSILISNGCFVDVGMVIV